MLIVYKFNFKLSIIGFLFVFRRDEKLHDVILGEQGTAQDSHDLYDGTSKLEVVLNDPDETVRDDGNMDLNSHGIVTLSPKTLPTLVLKIKHFYHKRIAGIPFQLIMKYDFPIDNSHLLIQIINLRFRKKIALQIKKQQFRIIIVNK